MLHNAPGVVSVESGERTETLGCQSGQLTADSQEWGAQRWFQSAPGRSVGFDQQRYRGDLQLLCQGNRLTVVNHLPLEDYISSVVGAEMPSHWPAEALRAQAVAARSYAMAHLAGLPARPGIWVPPPVGRPTGEWPAKAQAAVRQRPIPGLILSSKEASWKAFMPPTGS